MAVRTLSSKQQPYVGPRPFGREDAPLFFGRTREAEELLSLILAHPVVLLYAPSGAGKTSLLQAKAIPLLEARKDQVFGPARVGGKASGRQEIRNMFVYNSLMSLQREAPATAKFGNETIRDYLERQPDPEILEDFSPRRVIFFDQFEEIFTSYAERWRDRRDFFEEIGEALDMSPHLRIVFAMREEYIASLDPYADRLPERLSTRFRLEPLRRKAAKLAITGPLARTGRTFTPGAVEKLVENLLHVPVKSPDGMSVASGEFIEPMQLQLVCQRLWKSLPQETEAIDENYIRDYGDVDQALAAYYESCIEEVVQKVDADESLIRSWFEDALITSEGTRGLVFRGRKTTRELPNKWVDALEGLHLIRTEMRSGARWYELIHDRFISPIRESNTLWKKQRGRKLLSESEIEKWIEFRAFKQFEARKLSAKLGQPERLWFKFLSEPDTSSDQVVQDWLTAELVFALEVLEGGVPLSGKIGSGSLRRLEKEWLSEVKRTKAYLLWEEGNNPADTSRHQSDYYRACEIFRAKLADPEAKCPVEEFHPIEEYLRSSYLGPDGKLDEDKEGTKALLSRKAYRIWETSKATDPGLDWSHACEYARMFYDNILGAVRDKDEESTLIVLKAFQYSKAPENRYLIINCLEAASAFYFLDAVVVRKIWEESKENPGAEPYTVSAVEVGDDSGAWSPPAEFADRLSYDGGQLILRGVLRRSELDDLLGQTPSAWAEQIRELYRQSRLLPEETTI